MYAHFRGLSGLLTLMAILVIPGLVAGYFLRSLIWVLLIPSALVLAMLVMAALPLRKKITPQEFANQLEQHLLGSEPAFSWDDATSVRLADGRLEALRLRLGKFDNIASDEQRDELRQVIDALRRGEVPEVTDDYDKGPHFRSS